MSTKSKIEKLKELYTLRKDLIENRIQEFRNLGLKGNEEDIFAELCFCLLTPQSKAKNCWNAICELKKKDILLKGNSLKIKKELNNIRFNNNKTSYIISARKFFISNEKGKLSIREKLTKFKDSRQCREWLAENIRGLGYKEASHFLRNIGMGEDFAILDRHILKNLKEFKVIKKIPKSITKNKYIEIEKKLKKFAKRLGIPVAHFDLLLWSKETGEIFK